MVSEKTHDILVGAGVDASSQERVNFAIHLVSLCGTKIADGLINAKLVLAWLLTALGAPGYLIGALVPVREAGALLPQLAIANAIERRHQRKWVWALGSAMQGLAALGMAASALLLEGAAAGWAIVGCLAILAVARSACSASFKDVLARTVAKGARGTVSGAAGTTAAFVVFAFAAALGVGLLPQTPLVIAAAITIAGGLWLSAAAMFLCLDEPDADAGEVAGGFGRLAAPLKEDAEFRRYLATRILLISTALAPPFLVMLSSSGDSNGFGDLGLMLIGSASAAILSSYVWGRLSDRSSRQTLMYAGALAAVVFTAAAATGLALGGLGGAVGTMVFIFFAQIAHEGARAGRKTHLTDMDTGGRKTVYTALSNTIVGVMLMLGGAFGILADLAGPAWTLAAFAPMAAAGGLLAAQLDEVQAHS